jgi:hypothetical protein
MKTRSKIGNKSGNPAYRTPSAFRYQKDLTVVRNKSKVSQLPFSHIKSQHDSQEYKREKTI